MRITLKFLFKNWFSWVCHSHKGYCVVVSSALHFCNPAPKSTEPQYPPVPAGSSQNPPSRVRACQSSAGTFNLLPISNLQSFSFGQIKVKFKKWGQNLHKQSITVKTSHTTTRSPWAVEQQNGTRQCPQGQEENSKGAGLVSTAWSCSGCSATFLL